MQKKYLWISLGLWLSLLVSCAQVPDIPVCTEINMQKGFCVWTISDKEQIVSDKDKLDDKTWWEIRPSMVLLPHTSWVEIKTYIIKNCKQHKDCNKDITKWERKLNAIKPTK